jgi:hypothetical protein
MTTFREEMKLLSIYVLYYIFFPPSFFFAWWPPLLFLVSKFFIYVLYGQIARVDYNRKKIVQLSNINGH